MDPSTSCVCLPVRDVGGGLTAMSFGSKSRSLAFSGSGDGAGAGLGASFLGSGFFGAITEQDVFRLKKAGAGDTGGGAADPRTPSQEFYTLSDSFHRGVWKDQPTEPGHTIKGETDLIIKGTDSLDPFKFNILSHQFHLCIQEQRLIYLLANTEIRH